MHDISAVVQNIAAVALQATLIAILLIAVIGLLYVLLSVVSKL